MNTKNLFMYFDCNKPHPNLYFKIKTWQMRVPRYGIRSDRPFMSLCHIRYRSLLQFIRDIIPNILEDLGEFLLFFNRC